MRAAGGERAAWAYEWLPTGCPAVLVQPLGGHGGGHRWCPLAWSHSHGKGTEMRSERGRRGRRHWASASWRRGACRWRWQLYWRSRPRRCT